MALEIRFISSVEEVGEAAWDSLLQTRYPFAQYAFLHALEASGAVSAKSGWQSQHLLVYNGCDLVAAMPGYLKSHSYGEYVFDFQWAAAYQRYGMRYYPKLVAAIPFSPVTGPRLLLKEGVDRVAVLPAVVEAVKQQVEDKQLSGFHLLFPEKSLSESLESLGLPRREAVHFQWMNEGYEHFDDFLASFCSRKRKNLRKERLNVQQQGFEFEVLTGEAITKEVWDAFYLFYQMTYAKRSGHGGYLSKAFFEMIGESMADQLVLVMAKNHGQYIAGALNFRDSDTLYGRYWGCSSEYEFLHFETCYYQGIEYCLANGLQRFDPGVQGEHKIQRGFRPVYTWSNHYLEDEQFMDAITHFLQHESEHIAEYKKEAESLLPFRKEG